MASEVNRYHVTWLLPRNSLLIEPPANRTPLGMFVNWSYFSSIVNDELAYRFWYNYFSWLLKKHKLRFWAGIIKQLFGQLLVRYLIYLAYASPNIGSPCQINQISDSSRPNNCIIDSERSPQHAIPKWYAMSCVDRDNCVIMYQNTKI